MTDIAKMQPAGLIYLAQRLRNLASTIGTNGRPTVIGDLIAAADLADGLAELLRDLHSGDPERVMAVAARFFPEG